MKIMQSKLLFPVQWFLKASAIKKILIGVAIVSIGWFFIARVLGVNSQRPQYQTAVVEKRTLVSSLGESGQVLVANRTSVTTQASGVVGEVDVKNGDTVTAGEKIAVVSLDQTGQQRQAQVLSSYLSAKATLDSAKAKLYSLQSTMFSKWKTYTDIAENSTYQNSDGSPNTSNRVLTPFTISQDDWLAAEADYKNQQGIISQAQAAVTSSWILYQAASATITAPGAGTIDDLTIAPGIQIGSGARTTTASTNTEASSTATSQVVATIKTQGNPVVTVSLSEVDVVKVKSGQKTTVTFDALPNKTFTGKVLGINTNGAVSNGVTTYPASILLDTPNDSILQNMSATIHIITAVKDDVLTVPLAAVQTTGGQSMVRVLQNGKIVNIPVEVGISSDTQIEITSGLSEGDQVVVGVISTVQNTSGVSASPFGSTVRFGGFGGGGGRRN